MIPKTKSYIIGNQRVIAQVRKSSLGNRPVVSGPQPLWKVDQLPPLMVGDILAFKADPGFEQWAVAKEHAITWHWALAGAYLPQDAYGEADYQIIGSINKGIATELLSAYEYRPMRIYRPEVKDQEAVANAILKRCAYYGAYEYNWLGVAESAIDYLIKDFGIAIHLPVHHRFYCIQFVARLWQDFGIYLVPDWELVTPHDMENSKHMQLIWGVY